MNGLWKVAISSAVMVGLLVVSGCSFMPTPLPATAVPSGGLQGVISDSSSGSPVAGAQVTVAGQAGVFTLTTGADGKYEADGLPAGAYLVSVQAPGYYVSAAQVGVVANVTSSGNVALEPAAPALAAMPSPTAAPAPSVAPAPSAAPTPTPVVITVIPTPLPTPTLAVTPRPAARAPLVPAYTAAVLLDPRDRSVFVGPQQITFRWTGPCCLAADEYYVVSIPHPQGVEEGWVKGTTWVAPDYLYLLVPESRTLTGFNSTYWPLTPTWMASAPSIKRR